MKTARRDFWLRAAVPGGILLALGGCLGPNPGFFISTSIANATISNLVSTLLKNLLAPGGGGG